MSTTYNSQYHPPFPTLSIYLRKDDELFGPYEALLDTGADVTFIPVYLLKEAGALKGIQARVRSHFGEVKPFQLYLAGFQVEGIVLASSLVAGDNIGDEIILGRDILNKLPIFLDGVQKQTEILDDASVNRLRNRRKQP